MECAVDSTRSHNVAKSREEEKEKEDSGNDDDGDDGKLKETAECGWRDSRDCITASKWVAQSSDRSQTWGGME